MPSATPLPGRPSALVLGSAEVLLAGSGCPVCRYVAEAGDRYLAWFALEAHADAVSLTRLCASLGMCPRHTRALMSQPGAAARLTAVYRYLLEAARRFLETPRAHLSPCPACEHGEAAAGRALDILLDGLAEVRVGERYREVGGLCLAHLRAAAARGHRRAVARLVQAAAPGTGGRAPGMESLAGWPDPDAHSRARLRAALPPRGASPPHVCPVCLAAARSERDELARESRNGGFRPPGGPGPDAVRSPGLCAAHLRDAALMDGSRADAVLARQADRVAASMPVLTAPWPRWEGGSPFGWVRGGRRRPRLEDDCPVCRTAARTAERERERCRVALTAPPPGSGGEHALCVRDVVILRAADPSAGRVASGAAARRAATLAEELDEAFRKSTWAHRHVGRGREMTAWQRAAAFLDGRIFGGCPPPDV